MTIEIRDRREANWFWSSRDIVYKAGKDIGPYGIAVYVALCCHANDENTAWPSHETLAAEIGCSERKVRDTLADLVARGWLTCKQNFREDGGRTSNVYTLLASPVTPRNEVPPPPEPRAEEVESVNEKRSADQPDGKNANNPRTWWEEETKTPMPGSVFMAQLDYRIEVHGIERVKAAVLQANKYGKAHVMPYIDTVLKDTRVGGRETEDVSSLIAAMEADINGR